MSIQEWEYKGLKIVVPDQASLDAVDEFASKAGNDFMSFLASSKKGIILTLNGSRGLDNLPNIVDITLTPEKARELANFLLETTEGLV